MRRILPYKTPSMIGLLMTLIISACSKSESYSELLKQEEQAVNWYLAGQRVEIEIPADSMSFEIGPDAPFYRLDEEGYVYMQIVSRDLTERVETGDVVYFRFMRENLKYLYEGVETTPTGHGDYLAYGPAKFVYENQVLSSSTQWGTGIQQPLKYVGYNSEVNLVLKSYYGFTEEQQYCIPYLMNIKYFKPEY